MTQMLLFDSITEAASATTIVNPLGNVAKPTAIEHSNLAEQLQHDSGLNHMGELARLVLLRYELVAKRRAEMAARKAK